MAKKLRQLYGGRKPKSCRPAHNHVIHTPSFAHGLNGFRGFWISPQWVGRGWAKCPCGWKSHLTEWKTHYAHSDHVRWWESEIKKRGSLEAVHRHVIKRLATNDYRRGIERGLWDIVLEQMSRSDRTPSEQRSSKDHGMTKQQQFSFRQSRKELAMAQLRNTFRVVTLEETWDSVDAVENAGASLEQIGRALSHNWSADVVALVLRNTTPLRALIDEA